MYNFDKIDIKIVNLLLDDGRMPASEIARRIGDISERAVRYRIDRMVNEGIVQISAVARPQAFGLTMIADIWMEVESDRILEVAKKMAEFDNVSYVACGIGESDVSIQIVAKDTCRDLSVCHGSGAQSSRRSQDNDFHCAVDHQRCISMAGPGSNCARDF